MTLTAFKGVSMGADGINTHPVPEPSTLLLLGSGLAGCGCSVGAVDRSPTAGFAAMRRAIPDTVAPVSARSCVHARRGRGRSGCFSNQSSALLQCAILKRYCRAQTPANESTRGRVWRPSPASSCDGQA